MWQGLLITRGACWSHNSAPVGHTRATCTCAFEGWDGEVVGVGRRGRSNVVLLLLRLLVCLSVCLLVWRSLGARVKRKQRDVISASALRMSAAPAGCCWGMWVEGPRGS